MPTRPQAQAMAASAWDRCTARGDTSRYALLIENVSDRVLFVKRILGKLRAWKSFSTVYPRQSCTSTSKGPSSPI